MNVSVTWCGSCQVAAPGLVDLQSRFGSAVRCVGTAVDRTDEEGVRPYVEEAGVNFHLIAAPGLAARHFPGEVVTRTYLIDKQSRIRYKHTGVILKWALDDALECKSAEETG